MNFTAADFRSVFDDLTGDLFSCSDIPKGRRYADEILVNMHLTPTIVESVCEWLTRFNVDLDDEYLYSNIQYVLVGVALGLQSRVERGLSTENDDKFLVQPVPLERTVVLSPPEGPTWTSIMDLHDSTKDDEWFNDPDFSRKVAKLLQGDSNG